MKDPGYRHMWTGHHEHNLDMYECRCSPENNKCTCNREERCIADFHRICAIMGFSFPSKLSIRKRKIK